MGLSSTIKRSVRNAFKAVGDLAIDVTLQQKNNTDYDFGTNEVVSTTLITTQTKAIITGQKREAETENPSVVKTILVSAEDISDPDIYDKVVIGTETWNIVPPYKSDGFLTTLNLTREA